MSEQKGPTAGLGTDDGVRDADAMSRGSALAPGDRQPGGSATAWNWSQWRVWRFVGVFDGPQGTCAAGGRSRDEMSLSDDGGLD